MTDTKQHRAGAAMSSRRRLLVFSILLLVVAGVTFTVTAVLVTIVEHKQDARTPFLIITNVNEISTDPVPWGSNWPHQFETYQRSVDDSETEHGGSSALPASKLESHPWLRRLYAGYAFSIDYREARGHAYMLHDQEVTERVTGATQSGACLHCHASVIPTYRRLGLEARGQSPTAEQLAEAFDWPAVMEGFRRSSTMDYAAMHAELLKTPDGTPDEHEPLFPGGRDDASSATADPHNLGEAHPVSCLDCHDPKTMRLRVSRPGFMEGIAALARSSEPTAHLPSIERWRSGSRSRDYDPNRDAGHQEMRVFACAQCHVEYYCGDKMTLTYPWANGLRVEQIEQYWDEAEFPDGSAFYDYLHGETGAPVLKAQHPEFELWSQGVHAASGVGCADCHMPYERKGAMKVSTHWVRSPLLNIAASCQTCHSVPEQELRDKVAAIQGRTEGMLDRAAIAMTDMLDAIRDARAAGATDDELAPIFELQRKAMWRLDFISSENSMGFHADQEAVRVLGESIDYSRQAQAAALELRAPPAPPSEREIEPVRGVTPEGGPGTPPGAD